MAARLVFLGSPDFAVPALEALVRAGYDIAAVLTQPDKPAGRGRALKLTPVKRAAIRLGLNVQTPDTLRGEAAAAGLAQLRPDVLVVAAYAKLLPESILKIPAYGCLNIHPSLLPRHRGASPVPAAILAGDGVTGVSLMLMEKGLDTGPVLSQAPVPISDTDTAGSLTEKLARVRLRPVARLRHGRLMPPPSPGRRGR
jgi:methionyl-tRNA formyltransferase